MSDDPDVGFFVSFHGLDLDASERSQCIFRTLQNERCRNKCKESDTTQANILRNAVISTSKEDLGIDMLQDCILYNCCNQAGHRKKMEGSNLLILLANRWWNEVRGDLNCTPSSLLKDMGAVINDSSVRMSQSTTKYDGGTASHSASQRSLEYNRTHESRSSSSSSRLTKPETTSSHDRYFSRPEHAVSETLPPANQSRYSLRSGNVSGISTPSKINSVHQAPQSEFYPHKETPRKKDSVFCKIQDPIKVNSENDKIGSLYIFARASSPGYVKIGWSSASVANRLRDWSKCGYKPVLLFSIDNVPHARKVETLTHYELLKEWRCERRCRVCGASHREWFETDEERAKQIVRDWAEFFRKAEPYDSHGYLKSQWQEEIRSIDRRGELVTARKLLELHDATGKRLRLDQEIRKMVNQLCTDFGTRRSSIGFNGLGLDNALRSEMPPLIETAV